MLGRILILILPRQEQEEKAAMPSYLAAAQQTGYRIPPKRLTSFGGQANSKTEPESSHAMDLFFPTVVSPPRRPSTDQSPHQQDISTSWDDKEANVVPGSPDTWAFHDEPKLPARDIKSIESSAGRNAYRPPAHWLEPQATDQCSSEAEEVDSAVYFLALLGIESPKADAAASNTRQLSSNLPITQPAPTIPTTSMSGKGSAFSREKDTKSCLKDSSQCTLCGVLPGAFICLPCRHWGPCLSCVPRTTDKDDLYPQCLKCETRNTNLVRVYKH